MSKILALDISSSTIGWAFMELIEDDLMKATVIEYGHIKPKKGTEKAPLSLARRAGLAQIEIRKLLTKFKPDAVAIEDYASRFPKGKSTSRTIIVLATFNESMTIECINTLNIDPEKFPVMTIRSLLSKNFNKKLTSKEDVFEFIKTSIPNFTVLMNKNNEIKEECGDESDAIAVGLAYFCNIWSKNGKKINV